MKVKSESEVTQSCPTQQPHGLQPTRLLHPWDFPGKSTGVGCHCLLHSSVGGHLGCFHVLAIIKSAATMNTGIHASLSIMVFSGFIPSSGTVGSCMHECATLWTVAHWAPLSMGFSRQEYWSGLPCHPPGDLPDPGIKPASLTSLALAGRFFTTSATSEALVGSYGSSIPRF